MFGTLSPQLVQQVSMAAASDIDELNDNKSRAKQGLPPERYDKFSKMASFGSFGKFPSHCYSELMAILPKPKLELPTWTTIPMKKLTEQFRKPAEQAILQPHIFFSQLFHNRKRAFEQFVCSGNDVCEAFWEEIGDCFEVSHQSFADRPDYKRWGVPIRFYGDGTPLTALGKDWSNMIDAFHWLSRIVGRGNLYCHVFRFGCVIKT